MADDTDKKSDEEAKKAFAVQIAAAPPAGILRTAPLSGTQSAAATREKALASVGPRVGPEG